LQWALGGGGYAALFALPVAMLVGGVIGFLDAVSRSSISGNTVKTEGRLDNQVARIDDEDPPSVLYR
jgi:hypothetical protein